MKMDLGFAEHCVEKWRLLSHYFPSKLGGAPSWLSFENIPGYEELKCESCAKSCKFLLQIYSPDDEEEDNPISHAFHRSLFVFVCDDKACKNRTFKCFRSQLPRLNDFYSSAPPNENFFDASVDYPCADKYQTVCAICRCSATKKCSQCGNKSYCSKEHQTLHWKNGHKKACSPSGKEGTNTDHEAELKYFFEEFEVLIEPEELGAKSKESDTDALKDYEKYIRGMKPDKELQAKATKSDWDQAEEAKIADQAFLEFREKIAGNPDQIIRYDRGGTPLLVSDESTPPAVIPPCHVCSGERTFEFQVMSQTLSYLNVDSSLDSLDWGTLLIYTCKSSCEISSYSPEFIWKQDFSGKDVVETK